MTLEPIIARLNRYQHSSRRRTSLMQASMLKQIHKSLHSMYMQSDSCVLHRLDRSSDLSAFTLPAIRSNCLMQICCHALVQTHLAQSDGTAEAAALIPDSEPQNKLILF